MSNKDWTSKLRAGLADYQEPVSHDLWAGIEQSLAQNMKKEGKAETGEIFSSVQMQKNQGKEASVIETQGKKEPVIGGQMKKAQAMTLRRWSAAAAAIALLGVGGSYVYLHQDDVEQENALLKSHQMVASDKSSSSSKDHKVGELSLASVAHAKVADAGISHVEDAALVADAETSDEAVLVSEESITPLLASESEASQAFSEHSQIPSKSSQIPSKSSQIPSNSSQSSYMVSPSSSKTSPVYASSSSSSFFSNDSQTDWSVKLYAENLSPHIDLGGLNSDDSFNSPSRDEVASDPRPAFGPGITAGNIGGEDYLLISYKTLQKTFKGEAKHHAPVSVGMQVAFGIAPRLSLSTGFVYTRTSSDFKPYGYSTYDVHQVLHYVGIPVGVNYELWKHEGFHVYVMAGAEADYNVKNDTEESGLKKEDASRDRMQFSGKASLGAQYDITPAVGLYVEPGAKYYFGNGSDVDNTFKDKPLNFNLQFGLRLNL